MNNEAMWAIRDARGLNGKEKVFLFITESRGELFGKWDRNAADMGLSKNHYYEARASLLAKGLLLAVRRYDNTTMYVVNHEAFPYQECDSHSGNDDSRIRNADSRIGETKKNTKKNMKEELEEEQTTVPVGPVVDSLPNYIVKEELPYEKSLSVGSRDAAQPVPEIVKTSQGWRLGNVTYQREFDALTARQRVLEKEKAT